MGMLSLDKSVKVEVVEIKEKSVVIKIISELADGPYVTDRSDITVELKEGQSKGAL